MRRHGRLRNVAAADTSWIRERILPFQAYAVASLVPTSFEAYVRIVHPAWGPDGTPIRWDRIAAWSGRTMHKLAQFDRVARPVFEPPEPSPFAHEPHSGALPADALDRLATLLADNTTTPQACFLGVWEGCGWLVPDRIDTLRLRLPERTHLVFGGPLEAVEDIGWTAPGGSFMRESPSVVWPTDRAWFLAADVDQTSTYVGGTHRLAAALVAESELEAWPIQADDPITWDSDTINRET